MTNCNLKQVATIVCNRRSPARGEVSHLARRPTGTQQCRCPLSGRGTQGASFVAGKVPAKKGIAVRCKGIQTWEAGE